VAGFWKHTLNHRCFTTYDPPEGNLNIGGLAQGGVSLTNNVLPQVHPDLVSYSAYDSLKHLGELPKVLDYIESKLRPKPGAGLGGKRVFIGEYGFSAAEMTEDERVRKSRELIRTAVDWGCPLVLCWQMYNNEFLNGREKGWWLIDDQRRKTPLWEFHQRIYQDARRSMAAAMRERGGPPSFEQYRRFLLALPCLADERE